MIFSLSYTKKNMPFTLSQKSETDFIKGNRQKDLLYTVHHFIRHSTTNMRHYGSYKQIRQLHFLFLHRNH